MHDDSYILENVKLSKNPFYECFFSYFFENECEIEPFFHFEKKAALFKMNLAEIINPKLRKKLDAVVRAIGVQRFGFYVIEGKTHYCHSGQKYKSKKCIFY